MIQISTGTLTLLGLLLAACSALAGGAVAWGALRAAVEQLKALVEELRREVASLKSDTHKLSETIAVLRDRSERHHETGKHPAVS